MKMQLRKTARLLAATGALLLVSACGFDYATDRDYTPGEGTNNRDAVVDVLSAVVVAGESGSGTFIASFASNDLEESVSVTGITASFDGAPLTVEGPTTIEVPAHGLVNLADATEPITVTGDFELGNFLDMTFTFSDGDKVEMEVPSVNDCGDFAGLDATADPATAAERCAAPEVESAH